MVDRRALYVTAVIRAITTSLVGVLLGVYLARLHITGAAFGAIVSAGLVGATLAAFFATFFGDALGRRRFLLTLALLSVLGTVAFAWSSSPVALAAAACAGMLNRHGVSNWQTNAKAPRTSGNAATRPATLAAQLLNRI